MPLRVRRSLVTILGGTLLAAGFVLSLPLVPGPGLLIMAGGLAILATEYEWAERRYQQLKERLRAAKDRATARLKTEKPD